jgi:isopentenyl phosphate kinase
MIMRHFIKLGGSLITDKNNPVTPRPLVIQRLAREIAAARRTAPDRQLLISHGSGSYGHVVGRRYHTREGVTDAAGWRGFAETGYIAGQLNRLVLAALLRAGLPVISLPPSALVTCRDGRIVQFHDAPILSALRRGLIPLVFGDVAFDEIRGGTIVSTEEVLAALAQRLPPDHLTLAGVVDGVFDADPIRHPDARRIPHLRLEDVAALGDALGGSHGVDVTGGMASKIREMADLIRRYPGLRVHLVSGEIPGHLLRHLQDPDLPLGSTLSI